MAGIKAPILSILTKLETITVTNGDGQQVPLRARIWNNQLTRESHGELYDFQKPAAFLEVLGAVQYETIGNGYQSADIGWRVHLVHEQLDAGDGTMEQNLTVFDIRDKIVTCLSMFRPTACNWLTKTAENQDFEHTNIYHYTIDFICNFIDSTGSVDDQGLFITKAAPTDLELDIYINTNLSQVINYNFPTVQPQQTYSAQYTSDHDGVTQVLFNVAVGGTVVMAMIEIKPLLLTQYTFDPLTGLLALIGVTLDNAQTLFLIYSKPQ